MATRHGLHQVAQKSTSKADWPMGLISPPLSVDQRNSGAGRGNIGGAYPEGIWSKASAQDAEQNP